MVRPFDASDTGLACVGARRLDRKHHGFGSAVDEPKPFHRRYAGRQQFRKGNLVLRRVGEAGPCAQKISDRFADRREAVSVDECGEVVVEIEETVSVDIKEIGPLPALRVDRKGVFFYRGAGGSVWKHSLAAME
ncbi:hypothetical protein FQZ97_648880 [compost metagenome]